MAAEGHRPMSANRPNLLLVFSDQQHWQAMGCVDPFFDTPHLDAFARDSVRFDRSFCTTPQCSPSRSSLLTGLYPSATGVMGNVGNAGGEPLRGPTIGAELKAAGYHTGYFGKWHLGEEPVATAGWDVEDRVKDDPRAEANAIRFLEECADRTDPFALIVSINNPHDIYSFRRHEMDRDPESVPLPPSWEQETFVNKPPVQRQYMTEDQGTAIEGSPEEAWRRYHDCYREKTRLYDRHVGAILEALDRSGRRENTVVILTSDHGDMDAQHRLIFKGPFFYEHLIRVPLMIQLPDTTPGFQPRLISDVDVVNTDLVPTIRELCGLEERPAHGHSLVPHLLRNREPDTRDVVVGQYHSKQQWVNPMRMIRTASHKWVRHLHGERELYDLTQDPHELHNIAGDPAYADIEQELDQSLHHWMQEHDDPFHTLCVTDRQGVPLKSQTETIRKPECP